jgi:hypothetical protein
MVQPLGNVDQEDSFTGWELDKCTEKWFRHDLGGSHEERRCSQLNVWDGAYPIDDLVAKTNYSTFPVRPSFTFYCFFCRLLTMSS